MPVEPEQLKQPPSIETDREQLIRAVIEEIRPNLQRCLGPSCRRQKPAWIAPAG
ncbi:hypothetical protein [Bradyrhizobium valentinum]|uniref:hypothetical protein n=1 Tax=Bradyrhizobium valentinum TaxID=1518501 RepID=UPI000A4ADE74|nr:hypothetical protein [Bradyrhizobium valentinum]